MNLFDKQIYHCVALILLVFGIYMMTDDSALSGQLMGIATDTWMWLSISVPILHQIYVWVHYYTTELPDIRFIYSGSASRKRS
jgi:hypothetical protein